MSREEEDPSAQAAIGDIRLEYIIDPDAPARRLVYLVNKNPGQSVIATCHVGGSDNFEVHTLSQAYMRTFLPHDFEARVPPGGRKYIGNDRIQKFDLISLSGAAHTTRLIMYHYAITGARYAAPGDPVPPPPNDPDASVFAYKCPIAGDPRRLVFAVNVNHLWGVDFLTREIGGNDGFGSNVFPSHYKLIHEERAGANTSWRIIKHRFFEHVPPAAPLVVTLQE